MGDWASAIAQGAAAAADTGAQAIGSDIKNQQQLDQQTQLEQNAANIKFDLSQRMAAADQMMRNAALQRYAAIVKDQMAVPTDQEAPSWQATGLTAASAVNPKPAPGALAPAVPAAPASGSDDDEGDDDSTTPSAAPAAYDPSKPTFNFQGNTSKITQLMNDAQATLKNPTASADQKEAAQATIDGITQQIAQQTAANKASVSGKTRARTLEEAVDAANEYALQNDPEAYVAGTTAYNKANEDDMAQKRLDQQATLAREAGARQERLAQMREDALMAKLGYTGGGGKEQANIAQVEYLKNQIGLSQDQALAMVYGNGEGLRQDPAKLFSTTVQSLLNNPTFRVEKTDPPGTTLQQKAQDQARAIVQAALNMRVSKAGNGMLDTTPGTAPANPNDPLGLFSK